MIFTRLPVCYACIYAGRMPMHSHHWQLDSPSGLTSTGRCECGAEKEFQNSFEMEDGDWRVGNNSTLFLQPKPAGPNPVRQFTAEQVRGMRRRYESGETSGRKLAAEFGTSMTTIFRILRRQTYRDVTD